MKIPSRYICPISHDIMEDPVLCQDGYSYDKLNIQKWFAIGRTTSPITNMPLTCTEAFSNRELRLEIGQFKLDRSKFLKQMLLTELDQVVPNESLDIDHALVQSSCVTFMGYKLDTFGVIHGILLHWRDDPEVCRSAFQALARITSPDDTTSRYDFIGIILELLWKYENSEDIVRYGLPCLAYFCTPIQRSRACDIVTMLMKRHPGQSEIQFEGLKAIQSWNSTSFKPSIVRVLVGVASRFNEDLPILVELCKCIPLLPSACRSRLCALGLCRKLAEAMHAFPSTSLQEVCCLALGKITHIDPTKAIDMGDEGVCDALVVTLRAHISDTKIASAACLALSRLAHWERYSQHIGDIGGCELILEVLQLGLEGPDQSCVFHAMLALDATTFHPTDKCTTLTVTRLYTTLMNTLYVYSEEPKIVLSTLRTLYQISIAHRSFPHLAQDPDGVSARVIRVMRRHLSDEEIQEVAWTLLDILFMTDPDD